MLFCDLYQGDEPMTKRFIKSVCGGGGYKPVARPVSLAPLLSEIPKLSAIIAVIYSSIWGYSLIKSRRKRKKRFGNQNGAGP